MRIEAVGVVLWWNGRTQAAEVVVWALEPGVLDVPFARLVVVWSYGDHCAYWNVGYCISEQAALWI